jgi:hypothetical protein
MPSGKVQQNRRTFTAEGEGSRHTCVWGRLTVVWAAIRLTVRVMTRSLPERVSFPRALIL